MVELNDNDKVSIIITAFLAIGIAGWIFIPMAWPADTIFLTTKTGGIPDTCAPANGLVLAQNLTDLCDVTIISPTTNQLIKYNGSQWVNVDSSSIVGNATCSNLGSGVIVCASDINNVLAFKSLIADTGISITNDTNEITITNTLPENTVCDNAVDDNPNSAWCFNDNVTIRNIIGGDGIRTDGSNPNFIAINSYCVTQLPDHGFNVTNGCIDNSIQFKNLLAGSGITLSANSTNVTITNNGVTSNVAGTGINVSSPTGASTISTKFANGTGISITGTTTQTFTNTGVLSLTSGDTNTITYNVSSGNIQSSPVLKKLCETVAVGGETSLSCSLSSPQQYFFVSLSSSISNDSASSVYRVRFNGDTGNNYSYRASVNGGADTTTVNTNGLIFIPTGSTVSQIFHLHLDCFNIASSLEKSCYGDRWNDPSGAGTAPSRAEFAFKWANTANNISSVSIERTAGTSRLEANNQITVWGYS